MCEWVSPHTFTLIKLEHASCLMFIVLLPLANKNKNNKCFSYFVTPDNQSVTTYSNIVTNFSKIHCWVSILLIKRESEHLQLPHWDFVLPFCYSQISALHDTMTSWFITEIVEKKYEQCLKIALTRTWSVLSRVLWCHFLIYMYEATEIEAFVNINAYFIKLMHINPVL